MRRITTVFILLLVLSTAALAADDILRLKSGKFATGKITKLDERGVTLETEKGEAKYDWAALTPLCEYEVRADHVDPEDAAAHVGLAEFCLRSGLYPHARNEVATASGLGFKDEAHLAEIRSAADQAEADQAFAKIDQLKSEEDYGEALTAIREYIKQAPQSDYTRKARALIPDLIRRIDGQKVREAEEEAQAEKDGQSKALAKRINKYLTEAEKARAAATKAMAVAISYHQKGSVSRAKKGYLATEAALLAGYKSYGKVQSIVRRGIAHEKADKERDAIRAKLVEVYLGLSRLYLDDRNYKRGVVYVNRALYIDPVNKEALAYRKVIDENRIRRSARGLTNTPGVRVTGGTSR